MANAHETETPVSITTARADDPHMQPLAQNPARVEAFIAILFVLGLICFGLFGYAYWVIAKPWTLGATIGSGLFLIGVGMVAWGKYLMPR